MKDNHKIFEVIVALTALTLVCMAFYVWNGHAVVAQAPVTTVQKETDVVATTTPLQNSSVYSDGNLLLGVESNATLEKYLIGYNGMTLYKYAKDTATKSECTGECIFTWEAYVVRSTDALKNIQSGITGVVGSMVTSDGGIQVTYDGHPLYFYSKDTKSGDTEGNNVNGKWSVVKI
jgi:predicted lipoprotein with Yx(FWY)xxD motif